MTPEQTPDVMDADTSVLESAAVQPAATGQGAAAGDLRAVNVSAWFGSHKVLEGLNLHMRRRVVTALIGPSGCGKSTFIRILNRMHELVPSAQLAGTVLLDGEDIYGQHYRPTDTRRRRCRVSRGSGRRFRTEGRSSSTRRGTKRVWGASS